MPHGCVSSEPEEAPSKWVRIDDRAGQIAPRRVGQTIASHKGDEKVAIRPHNGGLRRISIRLSDTDRDRLERLAALRGARVSRVVADAVIHMLASVELRDPIHVVPPSEWGPLPKE